MGDRSKSTDIVKKMILSYGVTSCVKRMDNLLLDTLESLKNGGFHHPRIYIDDFLTARHLSSLPQEIESKVSVTLRTGSYGVYRNWILSLQDMFIMNYNATHFVVFQDDISCSKNLKEYLESVPFDENYYWNLFTAQKNCTHAKMSPSGFYEASKEYMGQGALGLMFSKSQVLKLLSSESFLSRPSFPRGEYNLDGAVVSFFKSIGIKEKCHNPSLVQHQGKKSTIGPTHNNRPQSPVYRGDSFDCLSLKNES